MDTKSPLTFLACKKLIDSGRNFLTILDDLSLGNQNSKRLLISSIENFKLSPEEKNLLVSIVRQDNTLSEDSIGRLRKRVLDSVNDASRDVQKESEKYSIQIKA